MNNTTTYTTLHKGPLIQYQANKIIITYDTPSSEEYFNRKVIHPKYGEMTQKESDGIRMGQNIMNWITTGKLYPNG